jgi:hypothetical protein
MLQSIAKSKIELEIENMLPKEAELLKDYFILLIGAGIHKIRNGKLILYFNEDGLMQIGTNEIIWKKKRK